MSINIRVPNPLVVASNGKLTSIEKHSDSTSTYHWFVSTPINVYNVALNIAPYLVVDGKMRSVAGDDLPVRCANLAGAVDDTTLGALLPASFGPDALP